ncbi:MAG: 50S ribosomal protein L30 [Acidobacteria bacterium]|nr:50S ribosomal protein L30 [Acidobacteriota bacterium]
MAHDTKQRPTVRVTLVKSTIGFNRKQAEVVKGLGLRRLGHTVELPDTPATRGMIHKVRHLLNVGQEVRRSTGRGMNQGIDLNPASEAVTAENAEHVGDSETLSHSSARSGPPRSRLEIDETYGHQ